MRPLLTALFLLLAASAHGQISDVTYSYLRDDVSTIRVEITERGKVAALLNNLPLVGLVEGPVTQAPGGGITCRLVLRPKKGGKQVVRGRYTLTRISQPWVYPGAPPYLTRTELHRVFQGKCSDPRMMKPHRRHFLFQGSEFEYPGLY